MHSINHRKNHNFQIAYFLAGSCHTPDGAYALLLDLKEEREASLNNYEVGLLKNEAKEIKYKKLLESEDLAEVKTAEAKLMELEYNRKTGKVLYEVAKDELEFINLCIEKINPLRQYKDLSDAEANEEMQREEWKLELINRVENYMITTGGQIPTDQFSTMRQHPDFQTYIMPRINEVGLLLSTPEGNEKLQKQLGGPKFKVIHNLLK